MNKPKMASSIGISQKKKTDNLLKTVGLRLDPNTLVSQIGVVKAAAASRDRQSIF